MRELPSETGVYTDEWVAEHFPPTDRIAPELAPGDALIFDHLTLHRTQPLDRETVSRMSIECRVTRHTLPISHYHRLLHSCPVSRLRSLEVLEPGKMFNDVFPGIVPDALAARLVSCLHRHWWRCPHFEEKQA
jgi:hypothetical protein